MNLVSKSGLLFNMAMAQNDQYGRGNYAGELMIDWAATIVEVATVESTAIATYWTIGLHPVVTGVVACYDGGKAMSGYGKFSGLVHFSWVVKLWGNTGSVTCGANSAPTGYVEILSYPKATDTASCLTNVQWTWNSATASTVTTTYVDMSSIITGMAEDYYAAATGLGLLSYLDFCGGSNILKSFGLGNWGVMLGRLDIEGVEVNAVKSQADATKMEDFHKQGSMTA
jgi:hypothetical protein